MPERPFRFGVSLFQTGSRKSWRDQARQVEDLGYDVLQVPDHLGTAAPFPALVAAADVTGIALGTFVLNTGVLTPAYLARDVADTWRLTDGRLELGLGGGYVEEEFAAAGLPFGTPGSRMRHLAATLTATRDLLAAEPDAPRPPLMLAGAGEKMLRFAAREADIVGLSVFAGFSPGRTPDQAFADRIAIVRDAAGDRFGEIELNLFVAGTGPTSDAVDLTVLETASGMSREQLLTLPGVLVGSPREIADRLQRLREEHGVSYISVLQPHMAAFAEVIALLR